MTVDSVPADDGVGARNLEVRGAIEVEGVVVAEGCICAGSALDLR